MGGKVAGKTPGVKAGLIRLACGASPGKISAPMATIPASPDPWRSALRGARAHVGPGLVLQAGALGLVLAYYYCAPARALLARLLELRQQTGFAFAVVSTGLFGGLLPFLYLRGGGGSPARYGWRQGAALTAFWAYKGIEVDLFYRILAHTVGAGHEAGTILRKVMIDQLAYCPLFAVPVTVAVYEWVEARFDFAAVFADWRAPRWYLRRTLPVLISNLGVWVPAVAIIYSLPTPLQLPLQNLVLCFFTLVIAHQTRRHGVPMAL